MEKFFHYHVFFLFYVFIVFVVVLYFSVTSSGYCVAELEIKTRPTFLLWFLVILWIYAANVIVFYYYLVFNRFFQMTSFYLSPPVPSVQPAFERILLVWGFECGLVLIKLCLVSSPFDFHFPDLSFFLLRLIVCGGRVGRVEHVGTKKPFAISQSHVFTGIRLEVIAFEGIAGAAWCGCNAPKEDLEGGEHKEYPFIRFNGILKEYSQQLSSTRNNIISPSDPPAKQLFYNRNNEFPNIFRCYWNKKWQHIDLYIVASTWMWKIISVSPAVCAFRWWFGWGNGWGGGRGIIINTRIMAE